MATAEFFSQTVSAWVIRLSDVKTIDLVVLAIVMLPALYLAQSAWSFFLNYRSAKRSGLPIMISLVPPNAPWFLPIQQWLRPRMIRYLPKAWADNQQVAVYGWEFYDKIELHKRIGSAFVLVTPDRNEVWIADTEMGLHVLRQRKKFVSNHTARLIMGFLGDNLLISDGDQWSRMRRLIAPSFNERISETVWDETLDQAAQMAAFLNKQPHNETRELATSLRAIAINVLNQVSYGEKKEFEPLVLPREPRPMTYVEAISLACELIVLPTAAPAWFWSLPFMPKVLRALGSGLKQLPDLTKNLLDQERRRQASNPDTRDNMMSMLVRISDAGKKQEGKGDESTKSFLTEEEISGNLFNFTAGGFDTTANTMAYAFVLLAVYPELQAWIQEELDQVFGTGNREIEKEAYVSAYPKLVRCLALLHETVRFCPPILHLSRSLETLPQTIPSTAPGAPPHLIDRPTDVFINCMATQHDPATWGPDSLDFKPSRWIDPAAPGQLITPARGSFIPWSGGPRICPGMKMAQVEFVAVVAGLLSRFTIEPVQKPGESLQEAREGLLELVQDSDPRLTLQMNRPEELNLRFVPR